MTKQYTNTREPGEFGDGATVEQGITDEAVEAAVEAAISIDSHSLRVQMRAALEAALPHLTQGVGEKEGEPPTDAEAKARLVEIIAKNPEDFGPGTNPLGDTTAALPHMGGVRNEQLRAIQNSTLYQCSSCLDHYPEGSCYPADEAWVLGDKVLCDGCLDNEADGDNAIRIDKALASHEPTSEAQRGVKDAEKPEEIAAMI